MSPGAHGRDHLEVRIDRFQVPVYIAYFTTARDAARIGTVEGNHVCRQVRNVEIDRIGAGRGGAIDDDVSVVQRAIV